MEKKSILFKSVLCAFILFSCIGAIQLLDKNTESTTKLNKVTDNKEKDVKAFLEENVDESFGFGIKEKDALTPLNITYRSRNGHFSPVVTLTNLYKNKQTYRIFALVNFEQEFIKSNNTKKKFIDVTVDPSKEESLDLQIDLKNNSNEVIFLVLRDPDYIPKDTESFGAGGNAIAYRALVEVDNKLNPYKAKAESIVTVNSKIKEAGFILFSNKYPTDFVKEQKRKFNLHTVSSFFVSLPVQANTSNGFIFLDSKGVCSNPYFYKSKEDGMASMKIESKELTCSKGSMVLNVPNPFKEIENNDGQLIDGMNIALSDRINFKD
ncbi:hypothetical protein Q8G32_28575 [Priestia megaterium]|uniref:hypothetical protein n=1 Tax=Priestia megaterium TaxID=1404 RepID=UPI00272F053B|nr:hypothetical protein [Priestia megaterium]MDP1471798.1 hypothetical protein [Priestia megaterium]